MKYKIIGWIDSEDETYPEGDPSFAIDNIIVDEIKKHKYLFTGQHHQYSCNCVPLLNNGKRYEFSQRAWGNLMALAYNHYDYYDYSLYAFGWSDDENYAFPEGHYIDEEEIKPLDALKENFVMQVNAEEYEQIKRTKHFVFKYSKEYRYLDTGDDILFICPNKEGLKYQVASVFSKKNLTKPQLEKIRNADVDNKEMSKLWRDAELLVDISLEE